jgi:hypothetical protein
MKTIKRLMFALLSVLVLVNPRSSQAAAAAAVTEDNAKSEAAVSDVPVSTYCDHHYDQA